MELMITVAVMGLAMVAILGAIWTTLRTTDLNTKTSNADTVLRQFAETMKQGCTTTDPADDGAGDPATACTGTGNEYRYVRCTTAGGQVAYPDYDPAPPYNSFDATVTQIRYLTGFDAGNQPTWSDSCPAGNIDNGLQELTLKVTGPSSDPAVRGLETVTIVKRDATDDVPRVSTDPEDS